MADLFDSYEALYSSILATTVLTNTYDTQAVADCKAIINFICDAYSKDGEICEKITDIILGELTTLSIQQDLNAFDASKSCHAEYSETEKCIEIKYDVIRTLNDLRSSMPAGSYGFVNYDHYNLYQPKARFKKLSLSSMKGDLISTRQTALLKVLGIGCPVDYEDAARKFLQCVLWGDPQSAFFLSKTQLLMGNEKRAKLFHEVAVLMETYLDDGITVLPEKAKKLYSQEAQLYFVYISSIKYDVVYAYNLQNIDFSFIEVMMSDALDFNKKMTCINEYRDKKGKNYTNTVTETQKKYKIGF